MAVDGAVPAALVMDEGHSTEKDMYFSSSLPSKMTILRETGADMSSASEDSSDKEGASRCRCWNNARHKNKVLSTMVRRPSPFLSNSEMLLNVCGNSSCFKKLWRPELETACDKMSCIIKTEW